MSTKLCIYKQGLKQHQQHELNVQTSKHIKTKTNKQKPDQSDKTNAKISNVVRSNGCMKKSEKNINNKRLAFKHRKIYEHECT